MRLNRIELNGVGQNTIQYNGTEQNRTKLNAYKTDCVNSTFKSWRLLKASLTIWEKQESENNCYFRFEKRSVCYSFKLFHED